MNNFKKEFKIYNLKELSVISGISYNTIRNYNTGRTEPKPDDVYLLRECIKNNMKK